MPQTWQRQAGNSKEAPLQRAELLVMVGLPASGKTTLAKRLAQSGWHIVSQDLLGDQRAAAEAARQALGSGQRVCVDGRNVSPWDRQPWREVARVAGAAYSCLCLEVPVQQCIHWAEARQGQQQGQGRHRGPPASALVNEVLREYVPPTREEGFERVHVAVDAPGVERCLAELRASGGDGRSQGNIVSFPRQQQGRGRGGGGDGGGGGGRGQGRGGRKTTWRPGDQPPRFLDEEVPAFLGDARPLLLFDLNGTLTSRTGGFGDKDRVTRLRPGVEQLARLAEHFHLGIYSSASSQTMRTALKLLDETTATLHQEGIPKHPGVELFSESAFLLYRSHTMPLDRRVKAPEGGEAWDTCKPLSRWFRQTHRVILVDDDAWKAAPEEERNMLLVPAWQGPGGPPDDVLPRLVALLLEHVAGRPGDARDGAALVTRLLAEGSAVDLAGSRLAAQGLN